LETGRLFGIMVEDRVAGLARNGEPDVDLWRLLANWTARHRPESTLAKGPLGEGSVLDLEYSDATAREHVALASAMAAENPWLTRPMVTSSPAR
jgi:hypothetical protein